MCAKGSELHFSTPVVYKLQIFPNNSLSLSVQYGCLPAGGQYAYSKYLDSHKTVLIRGFRSGSKVGRAFQLSNIPEGGSRSAWPESPNSLTVKVYQNSEVVKPRNSSRSKLNNQPKPKLAIRPKSDDKKFYEQPSLQIVQGSVFPMKKVIASPPRPCPSAHIP